MFTGLIQAIGQVVEVSKGSTLRLGVLARGWNYQPQVGDSISVSGVCLTIAAPVQARIMPFDVIEETLAKTTLGGLAVGSSVNLERSLAAGDLMGGHSVQGHVDGLGTVSRVQAGDNYRVRIEPPAGFMKFVIPKGAIAVDGVSLTIATADSAAGAFEVALIPTTLAQTTLSQLRAGDLCNLESDIVARTVVHYLAHYGSNPVTGQTPAAR